MDELADGNEYDLLNTYMLQTDQNYWIGLTDKAQGTQTQTQILFRWISGNPNITRYVALGRVTLDAKLDQLEFRQPGQWSW